MGLVTDAVNRLGLQPDQTTTLLNAMPTACAVTCIFGTIGTALILATPGLILLRIHLLPPARCLQGV